MGASTKNFILTMVGVLFVGALALAQAITPYEAFWSGLFAVWFLHDTWEEPDEYDDDNVDFEFDEATHGPNFPEDPIPGQVHFLEQEDAIIVFQWDEDEEAWDQIGMMNRSV